MLLKVKQNFNALFYNLNEETILCRKNLQFFTSKNSMSMPNSSEKENKNVERERERERERKIGYNMNKFVYYSMY